MTSVTVHERGSWFGFTVVRFLPVLVCLGASVVYATASDYWVSPTGAASWTNSRSATPLSGTAACSLFTANANASAGDIVNLRGGTYNTGIVPAGSGTASSNITYRGYSGETARISGTATAINTAGKTYITVDNVTADGNQVFADLRNANHVSILNSTLTNSTDTGGWPTGIKMYNNSQYNRIVNSTIGHVGYSTDTDDIGGVMTLGDWGNPNDTSGYNLLENNTFYHGGHHIIDLGAKYNIIRNNTFHNENWMSSSGKLYGNRGIIIEDDSLDANWNVIEGNRFAFMGEAVDDGAQSGMSVRNAHTIVRGNMFYLNSATGVNLYTDGTGTYEARYEHVYNNVFYRNGLSATDFRYSFGLLLDNVHGNNPPIPIENNAFKNNLFYQNTGGDMYFYYTDPLLQVVSGNYYATASKNSTPMGAIAGNTVSSANPLFVDVSAPAAVTNIQAFDFHLQSGSSAIDRGAFLTATTGAGSGTVIPVADAGYFADGFGIVEGDLVQLQSSTQRVRIASVDYAQNTLTLAQPLTWTAGQGVTLSYAGSAPDAGAYEYDSSLDADGDGMPDAWEVMNFGSTNAVNGGAQYDADGDGMSNLAEYLAGTSPTNRGSALRISGLKRIVDGQWVVSWESVTGRVYAVQSGTNLAAGIAEGLLPHVSAASGTSHGTVTVDNASTRFFRVAVE